jgi:hypothetical protein
LQAGPGSPANYLRGRRGRNKDFSPGYGNKGFISSSCGRSATRKPTRLPGVTVPGRYSTPADQQRRSGRGLREGSACPASRSRSRHILCGIASPHTSWNRAPMCARSNCSWVIAAWRPPRALKVATTTVCAATSPFDLLPRPEPTQPQNPGHPSSSDPRRWPLRRLKWRMSSAASGSETIAGTPRVAGHGSVGSSGRPSIVTWKQPALGVPIQRRK